MLFADADRGVFELQQSKKTALTSSLFFCSRLFHSATYGFYKLFGESYCVNLSSQLPPASAER